MVKVFGNLVKLLPYREKFNVSLESDAPGRFMSGQWLAYWADASYDAIRRT
jgi:hypothetical protein